MNRDRDNARSEAFRARLAGQATMLGAAGESCDCAPAVGWKSGAIVGGLVAGTLAFFVGATLADEHNRKRR